MTNSITTYSRENGGRVLLLFLLFLLSIYQFITAGFTAFAIVCIIPLLVFGAFAVFKWRMSAFWLLILINYFIQWKEFPSIGIPVSLPNEMLQILLLGIAIIEYPNLDDHSIPSTLLNMGTVNLMVTRANRTWKDVDQKALKEVESMLDDEHKDTLFMYLTEASRYAVEEFVGQLPPYTKFNNLVYRMSQLGLTAVENEHAK